MPVYHMSSDHTLRIPRTDIGTPITPVNGTDLAIVTLCRSVLLIPWELSKLTTSLASSSFHTSLRRGTLREFTAHTQIDGARCNAAPFPQDSTLNVPRSSSSTEQRKGLCLTVHYIGRNLLDVDTLRNSPYTTLCSLSRSVPVIRSFANTGTIGRRS